MKKSLVRIEDDIYSIIDISKNRVLNILHFDNKNSFYNELNKKKNIEILFTPSEIFQKDIQLNSAIKNARTLEEIIKVNLKKNFDEDLLFNYTLLEKDEVHNQNIYRVEAIKKGEVFEILKPIKNDITVRNITTIYHSLLAISSRYCESSFISIYIRDNKIIYVAGSTDKALFYRESLLHIENPLLKNENIVSDILRTFLYIKQKNRFLEFKQVLITGDIAENEILFENLSSQNINISVPLNFDFQNISNQEFIEDFPIFGLLYTENRFNFEPIELKAKKQYKVISKFLITILMIQILYLIYDNVVNYLEMRERMNLLQNKINTLKRLEVSTKTMDLKDIEFYLNYIKLENMALKKEILSDLSRLGKVFILIKPEKIDANEDSIKLNFIKRFTTLRELILLNDRFKKVIDEINKENRLITKTSLDFKNFEFKASIVFKRNLK